MNKYFWTFFCLLNFCTVGFAQKIADCKNPTGYALYHHSSDKDKKLDFERDGITGGMLSIVRTRDKKFDLIVVDSRRRITSMMQDGGDFVLLRKGETDATFLLFFPNSSIELYTLWLDPKGNARLDMLQSRGGDLTLLSQHKSSILSAGCDFIDFKALAD